MVVVLWCIVGGFMGLVVWAVYEAFHTTNEALNDPEFQEEIEQRKKEAERQRQWREKWK